MIQLLGKWFGFRKRNVAARGRAAARPTPSLEALEGRLVPATAVLTNASLHIQGTSDNDSVKVYYDSKGAFDTKDDILVIDHFINNLRQYPITMAAWNNYADGSSGLIRLITFDM